MRDILEGRVDINEVLVIVARTDVDPNNNEHWRSIWDGYIYGGLSNPEWAGLEDREREMHELLVELYESGKLHQPRQFGRHPRRMPYCWLDCIVTPEEHNPAQQKAWDNYKLITDLA